MEQKDYIDLDKVNVTPVNGDIPGLKKDDLEEEQSSFEEKKDYSELESDSEEVEPELEDKEKEDSENEVAEPEPKPKPIVASKTVEKKEVVERKTPKPKAKSAKKVGAKKAKSVKNVGTKKVKAKPKNKKSKKSNKNFFLIAVSALVIAGLILVAWLLFFNQTPEEQVPDTVAAMVNGVPIYESQVTSLSNWFEYVLGNPITHPDSLDLNVNVLLFAQEAQRRGLEVTAQDVDDLYLDVAMSNYMYPEDLKIYLDGFNIKDENIRLYFKNWLLSNQLINSLPVEEPSEEEILLLYESLKPTLLMPEKVRVRHIFFEYSDSEVEDLAEVERVFSLIEENKSNFCDLVLEYSDDLQSINDCGEYDFGYEAGFDDDFFSASFEMEEDELRIIKSQVGFHILYKVEHIEAQVPSLEESREYVVELLENEKLLEVYEELMVELTEKAIIEIYDENRSFQEPTQVIEIDLGTIDSDEVVVEEPLAEESLKEEPLEKEVRDDKPVKIVVETEEARLQGLARCLSDKAKVYNVYWSPDSVRQMEMFKGYVNYIRSFECDPSAPAYNQSECSVLEKQFPTWPTWIINGAVYEGIQSLQKLAEYSSCPY